MLDVHKMVPLIVMLFVATFGGQCSGEDSESPDDALGVSELSGYELVVDAALRAVVERLRAPKHAARGFAVAPALEEPPPGIEKEVLRKVGPDRAWAEAWNAVSPRYRTEDGWFSEVRGKLATYPRPTGIIYGPEASSRPPPRRDQGTWSLELRRVGLVEDGGWKMWIVATTVDGWTGTDHPPDGRQWVPPNTEEGIRMGGGVPIGTMVDFRLELVSVGGAWEVEL